MKWLTIGAVFFVINCAYAQPQVSDTTGIIISKADSIKAVESKNIPTITKYTIGETDIDGQLIYHSLDTSLDYIQVVNPAIRYFYHDLANLGSAAEPMFYSSHHHTLTDVGIHAYDSPIAAWHPDSIKYYRTNKRYSEVTYHQSSGPEQKVTITLAENITKNWNAGVDFKRLSSDGFLDVGDNTSGGRTFHTNINVFTSLNSNNNRYHLFGYAMWNTIKNRLTGGITNDIIVDTASLSNAELGGVTTFLPDARHLWKNHYFGLKHYYDAGRQGGDSAWKPVLRFGHDVQYEKASFTYSDVSLDSSLYNFFWFSPNTIDSIYCEQLTNKFSATEFIDVQGLKSKLNLTETIGVQALHYKQLSNGIEFVDSSLQNYFAEAEATLDLAKHFTAHASGDYVFSGPANGNYDARLGATLRATDWLNVNASLGKAIKGPAMVNEIYFSNHFIWSDQFLSENVFSQSASVSSDKYRFSAGVKNYSIDNYIFYDVNGYPDQYQDNFNVLQAFAQKDLQLWRFKFNNAVWWQQVPQSANDIINLPDWLVNSSLIYESWFFGKKLLGQAGFDLHYTSAYYSNAFNPATAQFILQREVQTNGYPLVDFFIAFKVKTARVFLKLQNVGDELVDSNYYQTPHYPMPGRVFQFGFRWRFFD